MGFRAALVAGMLAGALSGCSVSAPLAVESTASQTVSAPQNIALLAARDDETVQRSAFRTALGDAFSTRGITQDGGARLVADFAVSTGSAKAGVQRVPGGETATAEDPSWIDAPRRSRRFDQCDAQELRGTLILVDRQTGETVYRGRGMATECGFDDAALRSLADALVEDFLTRS